MKENKNQIWERMNMLLPVTNIKIFIFRKDYYCSKNKFYSPLSNQHLPRGLDVLIKAQDIFMEPSLIPTFSHLFYTVLFTMETMAVLTVS